MQLVQDCMCRAVLFQGFVVTSILDADHISLLLKCIIMKTYGRFLFLDNITDSRTELNSLTRINRRFFVGLVIHALDYKRGYAFVHPPFMCYGPSYQLFVVSKIYSIFQNKLLKVCRFE